jgi:hypothetical protein
MATRQEQSSSKSEVKVAAVATGSATAGHHGQRRLTSALRFQICQRLSEIRPADFLTRLFGKLETRRDKHLFNRELATAQSLFVGVAEKSFESLAVRLDTVGIVVIAH